MILSKLLPLTPPLEAAPSQACVLALLGVPSQVGHLVAAYDIPSVESGIAGKVGWGVGGIEKGLNGGYRRERLL